MKIKVSDSDILQFEVVKDKLLMNSSGKIFRLVDFKVIEEDLTVKTGFFKKDIKVIRQKYLVEYIVQSYHTQGKFVGILTDEATNVFLYTQNLYKMRQNWVDHLEMLKAYGMQVTYLLSETQEQQQ